MLETLSIDTRQGRLKRMKSGTITAARLIQQDKSLSKHRWQSVMVLLTYRPDVEYNPKQISAYLDAVRKWAFRKNFPLACTWVMELHESGKPHYHVIFWIPQGYTLPKSDKRGWWKHGITGTQKARNAVGYIAKYASKGSGPQQFPPRARIHGCCGLTASARLERRWWLFPSYLREKCLPEDDVIRCAGGGFVSRATGEYFPSEWGLVSVAAGRVRIVRLADWHQWHSQLSEPLSRP